ncbi:hypothetical protein JMJ35_003621 [Cladonia borealis]|uniref:Uncharacterized protein n=1 Tax=Cladonia borealis TaxID=184061 RepID=A0AA39V6B9_9LECA|nr:hypothetical protein JMJ35_003621 [Cladonia borealis]
MSNHPSSSRADDADSESCGAPASWADYINLPLNARILHSFSTYLASPRMWPVGYIIGSPYSPLQLEIEIPERNWRDRFEDLIALETGGQMISNESREKEAEVFFRLLCQESHEAVLRVNEKLERYSKRISIYERAGNFAARRANLDMVSSFETSAHQTRMESQELFDSGQAIISELKKFEQLEEADKPKRSGPSMMKGHWIASLFSRGALPGWRSRLYDSHLGPYWSFDKGDEDGISISDLELSQHFEQKMPLQFAKPAWSTESGGYPKVQKVTQFDPDELSIRGYAEPKVPLLRHSLCSQITSTERTKLPNGLFSTKVKIWNRFTDDREEEKHIIDDTGKVMEEVRKAIVAMTKRTHEMQLAIEDTRFKEADALTAAVEDVENDD